MAAYTFNDIVKFVVSRFDDYEKKSYANLEDCCCDAMIWDADVLTVLAQLANFDDKTKNESIRQYAIGLLCDYIADDDDLVEVVDD